MASLTKAQLEEIILKQAQAIERLEKASTKKNIGKTGFSGVAKDKDGREVGITTYEGGTAYVTVKWQNKRGEQSRKFPVEAWRLLAANVKEIEAVLD